MTDELQRISRQGWTEDELNDVFPGQKPASPAAAGRTDAMPLHPEIAKILATLPAPPPGPLDPAVAARRRGGAGPAAGGAPAAPRRRGPDRADRRRARCPCGSTRRSRPTPYGLLVYFHGGAFFLGSLDTHDHVARSLAKETGLKVVSVGYRLAPEARLPGRPRGLLRRGPLGRRERRAAWAGTARPWRSPATARAAPSSPPSPRWRTTTASTASPTRCCSTRRSTSTSTSTATPSLRENAVGYGLETAGLKPFNAFYLDSGADPADPRVSPIKRADLTGLPPALIITGELDPLRDEGELYGQRLQEAGVDATVSRYAGAGHGFVQHFSWIPEYHRAFAETARLPRALTRAAHGAR